jgi:parvulin-like peptidyl-prolyl isomerase
MLKKRFVALAGIVLLLAGGPAALAAPAGGPVMATVNGEPITQEALVQRLLAYHGKASLEAMINRALVNQEAQREGVAVTDSEVDERLRLIKNQLGGAEGYSHWLAQSGLAEGQHREQVRATLLTEKIVQKTDPIKDTELEQVLVRIILLPNEADAKSVDKILKDGGDFIQLARERSVDRQSAEQDGRLPPLMRADAPDVWKAIENLKVGQTTGPVKLGEGGGWAILKLEQRRPVAQQSEQERERNRTRLLSAKMDRWLTAARGKAKINYPTPLPTP